jgi:Fur family transcriptional regulator, ferric uptake regulator
MLVIEALEEADGHVSAEQIYQQLHSRYPYSNISTVYRTLELLKELNLVTETDFGEERVRYHLAEKSHHHHLVCRTCGKITDLDEAVLYPLRDILLGDYDFDADLRHLAISGECGDCRKASKQAQLSVGGEAAFRNEVSQRSHILLDYWIKHNREHEHDFRQWASKANLLHGEVAQRVLRAAARMAEASYELEKARQTLLDAPSVEKKEGC